MPDRLNRIRAHFALSFIEKKYLFSTSSARHKVQRFLYVLLQRSLRADSIIGHLLASL